MRRLKARTLRLDRVTPEMRDRMFTIFERYYASVTREQFDQDLATKEAVILLLDARSEEIQGFSTLRTIEARGPAGKNCRAIFSGDTVVDEAYWGQKVLGVAFLRYMWQQKARYPREPLYWFLISKGYKTYLLMANNFKVHYPRYEVSTPPEMQALLDCFAERLFGTAYQRERGLIQFSQEMGRLKVGVAELSAAELESHPRIRFFAERTPGWREGVELACIAEMTFWMPVQYAWKRFTKVTLAALTNAPWSPGFGRRQSANSGAEEPAPPIIRVS
jgi:hypothetical protein